MDGLPGAPSVIAVFGLALNSTQAIYNLLSGIKNGPNTIQLMIFNLKDLLKLLQQLIGRTDNFYFAADLEVFVSKCAQDLRAFEDQLTKLFPQADDRAINWRIDPTMKPAALGSSSGDSNSLSDDLFGFTSDSIRAPPRSPTPVLASAPGQDTTDTLSEAAVARQKRSPRHLPSKHRELGQLPADELEEPRAPSFSPLTAPSMSSSDKTSPLQRLSVTLSARGDRYKALLRNVALQDAKSELVPVAKAPAPARQETSLSRTPRPRTSTPPFTTPLKDGAASLATNSSTPSLLDRLGPQSKVPLAQIPPFNTKRRTPQETLDTATQETQPDTVTAVVKLANPKKFKPSFDLLPIGLRKRAMPAPHRIDLEDQRRWTEADGYTLDAATASKLYYDEPWDLDENGEVTLPPAGIDLSSFWAVEMIKLVPSLAKRVRLHPNVYHTKGLVARWNRKGRAHKMLNKKDNKLHYSVLFAKNQMHGYEGNQGQVNGEQTSKPVLSAELQYGDECLVQDQENKPEVTVAVTGRTRAAIKVAKDMKDRKRKVPASSKATESLKRVKVEADPQVEESKITTSDLDISSLEPSEDEEDHTVSEAVQQFATKASAMVADLEKGLANALAMLRDLDDETVQQTREYLKKLIRSGREKQAQIQKDYDTRFPSDDFVLWPKDKVKKEKEEIPVKKVTPAKKGGKKAKAQA